MRQFKYIFAFYLFVLFSCDSESVSDPSPPDVTDAFISGVDISQFPKISDVSPIFYDLNGNQSNFLNILKENGINTIRLKLWVNPVDGYSGFEEVKNFSQTLKNEGFKIWLSLHYSDTWADPSQQIIPSQWQNLDFVALKNRVYDYTANVVNVIKPDYIQIGNEINFGLLHPFGNISTNLDDFKNLLEGGISAVRANSNHCKIILHYAGIADANWFFNQVNTIDYDIIGLSYYPIWHGLSLTNLRLTMQSLSIVYDKQIIIAETAYPFTLDWNDWTNNIVGLPEQLVPQYPASPLGQKNFIADVISIIQDLDNGIGFCYWGAELIAWDGDQSTNGSPWENQALFDFDNRALPVLEAFDIE